MATSLVIETERLRLEPFGERHLTSRYVSWLNDPEIVRYSEQRERVHTLETCRVYARSFDGGPNYFWAIVVKAPERHIGNINAYVDAGNAVADVGILVGESAEHGRGYSTEAWMAICDFLFRTVGVGKITAGTLAINTAMVRLMDRVGMTEDGRKGQRIWDKRTVDVIHRVLLRDDWLMRFPQPPIAGAK